MIFSQIVKSIANPGRELTAYIALILMVLLTAATTYLLAEKDEQKAISQFEFRKAELVEAIERRLIAYTQTLYGGLGLFKASQEVERAEWRAYVETLDLKSKFPGIQGVGFAEFVKPEDKVRYERNIRNEGFDRFAIHPGGDRAIYSSITFLEPFDKRNRQAFGYDMYSQKTRRAAMDKARDTGEAAISGKVTLVQEITDDVQAGFLIYLPFYGNHEEPVTSVQQRRERIVGYVYSPFRMRDLMVGILGSGLPDVRLQIFDGDSSKSKDLMYDSDPSQSNGAASHHAEIPFVYGGHRWTLMITSQAEFEAKHYSNDPKMAAVVGLIMSLLVFGMQWSFATTGRRAKSLAAEMTRSLEQRSQQLAVARDQAQSASKAKSEFISIVSHELRTPLTSIKGSLGLLKSGAVSKLPDQVQSLLDVADRNANRLTRLVDDILDVEQIETGSLKFEFESLDLAALVRESIAANAGFADQHSVEFTVVEPVPQLSVRGDANRLGQVIANLLSNAAKFSPAGSEVTVSVEERASMARVSISDHGPGIPPEFRDMVFDRFTQRDSSDTRAKGGTGLGLNISKSIVERHGGSIGFDAAYAAGSKFFFELPIELSPSTQA